VKPSRTRPGCAPTYAEPSAAPRKGRFLALCAKPHLAPKAVAPNVELSGMLAFIEALALLAADLWLEGRLDDFATIEDPPDHDD
jgi:hypothetical protein